ncbi:MAG: family N-acetyltransferase [Marmoricola sp.]|nr:family N-acetyltransferase [Marmoricola sp.]
MSGEETLVWVRETEPVWDADKRRVIGGAPEGAFVLPFADGDALPGEWWAARRGGEDGPVVGYGRLDIGWGGDAEVLLAVDPAAQQHGVGSFVLASLEQEAAAHGINYVHNTIREHDRRDEVHDWLVVRGFRGTVDGELRKRVGADADPRVGAAVGGQDGRAAYEREAGERGPGHEEAGGYVDVEDHRY